MVRDFLLLRPEDEDSAMSLDFRRALDLKRCRNTVNSTGKRSTRARAASREGHRTFQIGWSDDRTVPKVLHGDFVPPAFPGARKRGTAGK